MRISNDVYKDGKLVDGFDYDVQAWIKGGVILNCGHPQTMDCGCYGRAHAGKRLEDVKAAEFMKSHLSITVIKGV